MTRVLAGCERNWEGDGSGKQVWVSSTWRVVLHGVQQGIWMEWLGVVNAHLCQASNHPLGLQA